MRPAMTFKLLSIGIEPRNESAVIPVINSVDDQAYLARQICRAKEVSLKNLVFDVKVAPARELSQLLEIDTEQ